MGKIIFYYIFDLAKRGINYFSSKSNEQKTAVKKVLDGITNNKLFVKELSEIVDDKVGIDIATANKIVEIPIVQNQIKKIIDSTKGEIDETELKNELKTILIKSWSDLSQKAVEKVKKDLK